MINLTINRLSRSRVKYGFWKDGKELEFVIDDDPTGTTGVLWIRPQYAEATGEFLIALIAEWARAKDELSRVIEEDK